LPVSPWTTKGRQAIRVASNGFRFSQDEACETSVAALTAGDTMLTTEEDKPGFAFKQQGATVLFIRDVFQITGITVASGPCFTFCGTAAE